jgi:hypothetical protein
MMPVQRGAVRADSRLDQGPCDEDIQLVTPGSGSACGLGNSLSRFERSRDVMTEITRVVARRDRTLRETRECSGDEHIRDTVERYRAERRDGRECPDVKRAVTLPGTPRPGACKKPAPVTWVAFGNSGVFVLDHAAPADGGQFAAELLDRVVQICVGPASITFTASWPNAFAASVRARPACGSL